MIIGLYGDKSLSKDVSKMLCGDFKFQSIGLKDSAKRLCDNLFDFKIKNLWSEKDTKEEDKRYFRKNKDLKYLTPEYALDSLISWGNDCYESIWADYAINIANTLIEKSDFDDVAHYSKIKGLEFHPLGHYEQIKNVCLTDLSSFEDLKKLKENNVKIFYLKSKESCLESSLADDMFDYVIEFNNYESFMKNIKDIVEEIYEI